MSIRLATSRVVASFAALKETSPDFDNDEGRNADPTTRQSGCTGSADAQHRAWHVEERRLRRPRRSAVVPDCGESPAMVADDKPAQTRTLSLCGGDRS